MAAILIFEQRALAETADGRMVSLFMDLYKLSPPFDPSYPEGLKFSWIAFEEEEPQNRVLMDCHSPKGPHLHIDSDPTGVSFHWESLLKARELFYSKIVERFGEIPDLKGVIL